MKIISKRFIMMLGLFGLTTLAAQDFYTTFAKGKWDRSLWFDVKSARRNYLKKMVQLDDHIMNAVPPDLTDEVIFAKYVDSVYSCIMLREKYGMPSEISCTMSFDHRMAPLIVLAKDVGRSAKGEPEQREHYEIILFDEGINVWHHFYNHGKPQFRRAAFLKTKFLPRKKYKLRVRVTWDRKGKYMQIECGGHTFGFMDEALPETFYAGIIGCEGRNRFYDFGIRKTDGKP